MHMVAFRVWLLFAVVSASPDIYKRQKGSHRSSQYMTASLLHHDHAAITESEPLRTSKEDCGDCFGFSCIVKLFHDFERLFEWDEEPFYEEVEDDSPNLIGNLPSDSGRASGVPSVPSVPSALKRPTGKGLSVSFGVVEVQITREERTLPDFERRNKEFLLCVAARSGDLDTFHCHLTEYKAMRGIEFDRPDQVLRFEYDPDQQDSNTERTLLFCAICGDNPQLLQEVLAFHQISVQDLIPNYLSAEDCKTDVTGVEPDANLASGTEIIISDANFTHPTANDDDDDCCSGLIEAARGGAHRVVSWLIDNGARDTFPLMCETALHAATEGKHEGVVRLLLERGGSNINAIDGQRRTPLHLAVKAHSIKTVRTLLSHDASVSMADSKGNTPLHVAAEQGLENIAAVLLEFKAPASAQNSVGDAPLHLAVKRGCIVIVRLLLKHGASVSAQNSHGNTPLHYAAMNTQADIALELLKNGASMAMENQVRRTPLHNAVESGSLNTVVALTSGEHWTEYVSSCVLNVRDKLHGNTALHLAGTHPDIYAHLLNIGAKDTICNRHGVTPRNMFVKWLHANEQDSSSSSESDDDGDD